MTRAEELTTKVCTLSYDHERLRTTHDSAKETVDLAERESDDTSQSSRSATRRSRRCTSVGPSWPTRSSRLEIFPAG
ncbi:hypothetical protein BJV78DRAFT_1250451 [Lactifluus subvellereus]|nr:hypothetical protein BJV78DRAFT_1250451 [Lactifluus subvellereus]